MNDDIDRRLDRLDELADTAETALRDLRAEIAMLHAVRLNTAVRDQRRSRIGDVAPITPENGGGGSAATPLSHPHAGAGPDAA